MDNAPAPLAVRVALMKLWVDDLRPAPEGWQWAKSSATAILALAECTVEMMSLDHDLGGEDTTRPVVLWMCESGVWPASITVHSANPVGRQWLEGMISRYRPCPLSHSWQSGGLDYCRNRDHYELKA